MYRKHRGFFKKTSESKRVKFIYVLADSLVDSIKLNAWEYGNTGNFIHN